MYKRIWRRVSYHAPIALLNCDSKFEGCCQERGWIFCGAVLNLHEFCFLFCLGMVMYDLEGRLTKDKIKAQQMHQSNLLNEYEKKK